MKRALGPLLSLAVAIGALLVPVAAQATLSFVRHPLRPAVFAAGDNGSKLRRIALGSNPHVSPDGRMVAYLSPPRGKRQLPQLRLATVSGRIQTRWLASEMQYSDTFSWSPDSTKIAAVRVQEDGTELLTLIDIAARRQRTVARGYFSGVSFDPESTQLVYGQARKERFPPRSDVRLAPVAGGKPALLTHDHRSLDPLWGPAGQIVFVKQLGAKQRKYGPKNELFLMDPERPRVRRLTRTKVDPLLQGLVPTEWSANGRRLLAEFVGQDTSYAVTVNPRSGSQHPLTRNPETGLVGTALAADGRTILGYTGGFDPVSDHNVVRVPYGGGRGKVLVRKAYEPDWSR